MSDETHDVPEVIEGGYDDPIEDQGDLDHDGSPLDALDLPERLREEIALALIRIDVTGVGSCTPAPAPVAEATA